MTTTETKTISRDLLQDVLEASEIFNFDTINDTYSGRGMNGATCLSFVIEGHWGAMRKLAQFMATLAALQAYDVMENDSDQYGDIVPAQDMAKVVSLDDLGMDTIVYFPGWTLED